MNAFELTNPIQVTKRVAGIAGTAVGLTGAVAREAVHAPVGVARGAAQFAGAAAGFAGTVVRGTAQALRAPEATTEEVEHATVVPPGPNVVRPVPQAPEEPPVDVVGQALAAEAAADRGDVLGGGVAHEPRGASRDEEHGEASLQRAEEDELAEEVSATLTDED